MDVQERVRGFVLSNFFVDDPRALTAETPLVAQGIVDSTGVLEVIAFLESEFGIRVEDRETTPENLGSISAIAAFVARKRHPPGVVAVAC